MLALHDIPDPEPYLPGVAVPLWAWILAGVVVAGALVGLVLLLLRQSRARGEAEVVDTSFQDSRDALEALRPSSAERPLADIATDASLILRHYLAITLNEPALYETHEEFLLRSDALADLPAGARERLAPLLSQLASAKYGPSAINAESGANIINHCLEVLQGLESTRERKVA